MAFDLTAFAPCVHARASDWDSLGLKLTVKPIRSKYSPGSTMAELVNEVWLVTVTVWGSGALDLDCLRIADRWFVGKQYVIEHTAELDGVVSELIGLVETGNAPDGAFTAWWDLP